MRPFVMITGLMLFAGVALPQEPSATVTKIVRVRYANPDALHVLLQDAPGVQMRDDRMMKVVILRGNANAVAGVEQSIHDLDVPSNETKSKDVELIVSVIDGSSSAEVGAGGPIAEDLAPVVRQLRTVFPYRSYQAVGSMLMRSREGAGADNAGVMKNAGSAGNDAMPSPYTVQYGNVDVSLENGKPLIQLHGFDFRMHVRTLTGSPSAQSVNEHEIKIKTDVDLREGEKVVVGKANVESSDSAVFVVLTARLVD